MELVFALEPLGVCLIHGESILCSLEDFYFFGDLETAPDEVSLPGDGDCGLDDSIHELDRQWRRMETEKEELWPVLEEDERSLKAEEKQVLEVQLELAQVSQEMDQKITEKEGGVLQH